jgi:hypothetical protein
MEGGYTQEAAVYMPSLRVSALLLSSLLFFFIELNENSSDTR